ncbi:MAG: MAPEG family protein [Myxococcota bacterium]
MLGKADILLPCAAMVLVTAIVWLRLYVVRLGEIAEKKIEPQSVRNSVLGANAFTRVEAADNFKNLFEVPVLFYVLCVSLAASEHVTPVFVAGAWLFVGLRAVHSYIHCTYNLVMHRFYVYAAGTVVLYALWGVFAFHLIAQVASR